MTTPLKSGELSDQILTSPIYWGFTGLLSLMMIGSALMYFFNNSKVVAEFEHLGFPTYIIYPLATLKLLGVVAIVTRKSKLLTALAYAGFFYNFLLATSAHINVGDGEFAPPLVALVLLIASFIYGRRVFG